MTLEGQLIKECTRDEWGNIFTIPATNGSREDISSRYPKSTINCPAKRLLQSK